MECMSLNILICGFVVWSDELMYLMNRASVIELILKPKLCTIHNTFTEANNCDYKKVIDFQF